MVKGKGKEKSDHPLISEEEMLAREQKYVQSLRDIKVSVDFIKAAQEQFSSWQFGDAAKQHWQRYIRCDGLPRPNVPAEIRNFIYRIRHMQQLHVDDTIDWTLAIDERSILNQNIFRTDKTRRTLQTACPNIGQDFARDVRNCLELLRQIDYQLDNEAEMSRISYASQMDIVEVRAEIESEIEKILDRLTYRLIRMDNIYMKSQDGMIAQYSYKCNEFSMEIWGLRNVPIRFKAMEYPLLLAELRVVGARVQMPLSVLMDNLTLRCLHMNFDSYSQNAKSYDCVIEQSTEGLNAGIIDIEDCLINEWLKQVQIQEEIFEKLKQSHAEWEEFMLIYNEKLEQSLKKKNEESKGPKLGKPPKEPQFLPLGMLPDPYAMFLEREQQQYMDFLNEIFNPLRLQLTADEINLRQHIMLGGIYSIMFVHRPAYTHFETFNITLHEDGRLLYTMQDVVVDLDGDKEADGGRATKASLVSQRAKSLMMMHEEETKRLHLSINDDALPYFNVTIQLPPSLCLWGEPTVCQYIKDVQEIETGPSRESLDAQKPRRSKKPKKGWRGSADSRLASVRNSEGPRISFNQIERSNTPHPLNFFRSTLLSRLRHSKRLDNQLREIPLQNFKLGKQLEKTDIFNLQRYCVPRLLSSYQLPMEIKEHFDEEEEEQKPKAKRVLVRRKEGEAEVPDVPESKLFFEFENQHGPERLYPVFQDVAHVSYPKESIDEDLTDKSTIYGLLSTLDGIKLDYTTEYKRIMDQPNFSTKKDKKKEKQDFQTAEDDKAGAKRQSIFKTSKSKSKLKSSTSSLLNRPQFGDKDRSSISVTRNSMNLESNKVKEVEKEKIETIHWTKRHILETKFNREEHTVSIKTDRLGIFGFAFKRYEHFPFRDWSLQPSDENPEEVILTVDTFHVRVLLYISNRGIRGYATKLSREYVAKPIKYLEINHPISDFHELRKIFYEKNINIFAEHDACFYIENGYFSIKHLATERHNYDAMAVHCKTMRFYRSNWNPLSSRRDIILTMKSAKDLSDYSEVTVRITPERTTFVTIDELCSDDLDVIKLNYNPTWRNVGLYSDLHQAIVSMHPTATDQRVKDPILIYNIKRMLSELSVFSFS